jgi:hypothetical protein
MNYRRRNTQAFTFLAWASLYVILINGLWGKSTI